jgi:hypothetical protein
MVTCLFHYVKRLNYCLYMCVCVCVCVCMFVCAHFLTCADTDILLHPTWNEYGGHKKGRFSRYGVKVEGLKALIETKIGDYRRSYS